MNGRYDEFMRHRRLVRQLESANTPEELGRALVELGIEIWGITPVQILLLYPELVGNVPAAPAVVLPEDTGA